MICRELIEGCEDCAREEEFLISIGHDCGEDTDKWRTVCTIWGEDRRADEELHRASHEPETCESCGAILADRLGTNRIVMKTCRAGCCTIWACPDCGDESCSSGPVNCPVCGSGFAKHPRIRRMRRLYAARKGHRRG
jgi:hypothetical protein